MDDVFSELPGQNSMKQELPHGHEYEQPPKNAAKLANCGQLIL